jgi:hypothetical protein
LVAETTTCAGDVKSAEISLRWHTFSRHNSIEERSLALEDVMAEIEASKVVAGRICAP